MEDFKNDLYQLAKEQARELEFKMGVFKVDASGEITFSDKASGDLIISNRDESLKKSLFSIEFEDLTNPYPCNSIEDGEELGYIIVGGVLFLNY